MQLYIHKNENYVSQQKAYHISYTCDIREKYKLENVIKLHIQIVRDIKDKRQIIHNVSQQ